jgi:hypothetical protein
MQGLLAGEGLCVQEEPLGGPAAAEDFSARPAVYVVAGSKVNAWADSAFRNVSLWTPMNNQGAFYRA